MKPSQKLAELNLELPAVAAPVGSYVPAIRSGRQIYTSGQLPFVDGKVVCAGKVGGDVTLEQAAEGARLAGLNALAAATASLLNERPGSSFEIDGTTKREPSNELMLRIVTPPPPSWET